MVVKDTVSFIIECVEGVFVYDLFLGPLHSACSSLYELLHDNDAWQRAAVCNLCRWSNTNMFWYLPSRLKSMWTQTSLTMLATVMLMSKCTCLIMVTSLLSYYRFCYLVIVGFCFAKPIQHIIDMPMLQCLIQKLILVRGCGRRRQRKATRRTSRSVVSSHMWEHQGRGEASQHEWSCQFCRWLFLSLSALGSTDGHNSALMVGFNVSHFPHIGCEHCRYCVLLPAFRRL